MATLSVIRRWALREQLSIRKIAQRTGLSRNTIKKYLRAEVAGPRYAKRVSPSKLDAYADKLSGCLKTEATESRKQRRTLKQMHADLVALAVTPPITAWPRSRARGRQSATRPNRPAGAAPSCRWRSAPEPRACCSPS